MKLFRWIFVGLALMLAGCAQVFPTAQSSALPTPTASLIEPATDVPATAALEPATAPTENSPTEAVPEQPTGVPPTEAVAEPTTAPPTDVPAATGLGSPELHATDPATVSLASGKVQLVEFFAFW